MFAIISMHLVVNKTSHLREGKQTWLWLIYVFLFSWLALLPISDKAGVKYRAVETCQTADPTYSTSIINASVHKRHQRFRDIFEDPEEVNYHSRQSTALMLSE